MAVFPKFYKPRPYQAEAHQMWQKNLINYCQMLAYIGLTNVDMQP